ncbi:MAG: ABC transporter permease subunit [Pseudomonadales bacterium]|nr:ABC transporter permease subunit [Pseudomonadales bacterium]MDG1442410.1 ABC transporter permease subunit [Pseudomonadales bacterium]
MFLDILKFELNYHRKQYLLYVLSGTFFILFFLATTSPNVQIGDGVANVNLNSPYTIMMTVSMISAFSMFAAIAFCSNAVVRDFELGTAELFLSRPIKKFDYVYGRYLGTLLITIVIYCCGVLGIMVGELMPWLDAERLGTFRLEPYLYTTAVIGLPNIIIMSSLFFFVSTVTRSIMATYVVAVGLLMLSVLLDSYIEKDMVALVSFLDPFGTTSLEEATRYWTVFEKNEQLPSIDGTVILNRIIWMSFAVLTLVGAYPLFPFSLESGAKKFFNFKSKKSKDVVNADTNSVATLAGKNFTASIANPSYGFKTQLLQCLSQTKLETLSVVKNVPFIVILLFGLMQVTFGALGSLDNAFGTSLYASTYNTG